MRYYVYRLRDPRCGTVFYIGKGSGRRIDAHEKESARGIRSAKCDRIRDIRSAGLEVVKEKLRHFADERVAYQYEAELIANTLSLTNGGSVGVRHDQQYRIALLALKAIRGELRCDPRKRWSSALLRAFTGRAYEILEKFGGALVSTA